MTLVARPTTYKGIPMRSRLEARFAAYLDAQGYRWTYEPRAFADDRGQYLPDFELHYPELSYRAFIEVRPTMEAALKGLGRMQIIWSSEPDAALMVVVADTPTVLTAGNGHRWSVHEMAGWPT